MNASVVLINDPGNGYWDSEVDVVIVGFGGAGACAAIEAADNSVSVLAIDRFDGGGATAASGGVYYGGGTRFQRDAGFDDNADEMYKYLDRELGGVVAPQTLRRFCDENNANLEWLVRFGMQYGSRFNGDKTSFPGKGVDLYYSGNEVSPAAEAIAKPAARGHKVIGEGQTGHIFYDVLKQAAIKRGVKLWAHSPVTKLLTDANGSIVGVEVNRLTEGSSALRRHASTYRWAKRLVGLVTAQSAQTYAGKLASIEAENVTTVRVRARKGVVLASGGYIFNHAMMAAETPLYKDAPPLGIPGCDGSGIALGRSVGGATDRMDYVCASRSIAPPLAFVKGAVVNANGQRFVNEDAYTGTLGRLVAESPNGTAWLILDRTMLREALVNSLPGGGRLLLIHCLPSLMSIFFGSRKAATLAALAGKCGLPTEALQRTIAEYNESIAINTPDAFGKRQKYRKAITTGPFYALDISLRSKTAPLFAFTLGGLVVDEDSGEVKRSDGTTISGLYATGRAAVGLPSNFYISGLSIADCVFSGRRAGKHAAARASS